MPTTVEDIFASLQRIEQMIEGLHYDHTEMAEFKKLLAREYHGRANSRIGPIDFVLTPKDGRDG